MLNTVDIMDIGSTALLVAVGTIGLTQLLKNFFSNKKGKKFAIISTLITAIICVLNSSLVPPVVTVIVDTFVLSLAITQLSWDVLAGAIPTAVKALFEKMIQNVVPRQ